MGGSVSGRAHQILRNALDEANFRKLAAIENPFLHQFVAEVIELCQPSRVFVCTDSEEDKRFIREQAVATGEERPLAIEGHTVHFDGPKDQGRDREATKYLVPKGESLGSAFNQIDRDEGLAEIRELLRGSMRGHTLIVLFFSLGPVGSPFSILCVQCTDSFYVAHNEILLYRTAYEQFRREGKGAEFFRFVHSSGRLDENMVSVDWRKRRIYIDYITNTVYSVNTQYAGNSMGLKKLALRLAIRKAAREGWLAEHMFIMGVHGPGGRKTYFAGAFPSGCGKTSTAMTPGETILADDIAYIRNINGEARAVNPEIGIFGILKGISPDREPLIYRILTSPGEVIFSNVLVKDGRPYWLDMGRELPKEGVNPWGRWWEGKTDEEGNPIPPAHKNARYTVSLHPLPNCDPELDNPMGVPLSGIIYGCRDARAYVIVQQGFDWLHGIIAYGAALETVTMFTVLDEGKEEINVMAVQDFLSISVGEYLRNYIEFGKGLREPPAVFGVNYFLLDENGEQVANIHERAVWLKWMERRVHGDVGALLGPTGLLPKFDDLRAIYREVLGEEYPRERYERQFTIRVPENLAKIERVERFYQRHVPDAPEEVFQVLGAQRERLLEAQRRFGDRLSPFQLEEAA